MWMQSSFVLSLDVPGDSTRIRFQRSLLVDSSISFSAPVVVVNIHHFEETINGREYRIEVSEVGVDRWRAQLVRHPGSTSAMMPFYGSTPADAAQQLSAWLLRAHRHAANPV